MAENDETGFDVKMYSHIHLYEMELRTRIVRKSFSYVTRSYSILISKQSQLLKSVQLIYHQTSFI